MTYLQGHGASGLKVGDTVRVTRKAKDYEQGWGFVWMSDMDAYVGKKGKVIRESSAGYCVDIENKNDGYWYPYFVLEKVTPKKSKEKKEVTLDAICKKHGIKKEELYAFFRDLADWVEGKE